MKNKKKTQCRQSIYGNYTLLFCSGIILLLLVFFYVFLYYLSYIFCFMFCNEIYIYKKRENEGDFSEKKQKFYVHVLLFHFRFNEIKDQQDIHGSFGFF